MIKEIIKYNCSITRKVQNAKRKVQNVYSAIKQKTAEANPRPTIIRFFATVRMTTPSVNFVDSSLNEGANAGVEARHYAVATLRMS
ncbi:MAG: hypothetical protein IKW34_05080, partial [Clostridia bacterium]|nr:hypothetical protein [Clostridia bacterium]